MSEVEPRVVAEDVAAVLRPHVRPDEDTGQPSKDSVKALSKRSGVPSRTIQSILSVTYKTTSLGHADALCVAVGTHLSACRLAWPDGEITAYSTVRYSDGR